MDLQAQIHSFLREHYQFALATYGQHPWIATMYYAVGEHLEIIFLTEPRTIHAQALNSNPEVAAVIADSPQKPDSQKKGLQIYGHAEELKNQSEIEKYFELWRSVLNVTDPKYSFAGIKSGELHYRLYKLTPKKIKFYNEELWEEGDEKILELS